ncbi:unnamed protein product [Phytophthora fragariaefolia]|uniref:Unnamed protein product n=1 Tax=Phytophthora fragariaefolia TaxID=1490495 RepID=A0A9W7D1N1_9STRA|nr:unnamed protein product [Phytophthora fragariaefolia]
MVKTSTFLGAAVIATCTLPDLTSGHQDLTRRALSPDQRKIFAQNARRALEECTKSSTTRKLQERTVSRRTETIEKLRQQRRQRRLDAATVLSTNHKSSDTVTKDTTGSELFDSSAVAIVEPELTEGPYYISGELIRDDMRDSQEGVDMYINVQVVDVGTCEPVKDMYVDFWHTNATGVYSGVVASTNGNSNDETNLKTNFLRGMTPTDEDGVAQMLSIFPGHYSGRTTHVHFIGNYGGEVLANNTYSGASVSHVGQFFFDQDLISLVEAVSPYSTNTQTATKNSADKIFKESAATGYDPVMTYALLGDTVDEGLYVWISVAVDMTADRDVNAVSALTATGTTTTTSGAASDIVKFGGFAALVVVVVPFFFR